MFGVFIYYLWLEVSLEIPFNNKILRFQNKLTFWNILIMFSVFRSPKYIEIGWKDPDSIFIADLCKFLNKPSCSCRAKEKFTKKNSEVFTYCLFQVANSVLPHILPKNFLPNSRTLWPSFFLQNTESSTF